MTLSMRPMLTQRQSLAMTPQLMQAIKLLQMSNLELEAAVREEVEQNPLLSLARRPDGRVSATVPEPGAPRTDPFATVAAPVSLAEHCAREAAELGLDPDERAIAQILIGSLGEDGRLDADAEAAAVETLGVSHAAVAGALAKLQTIAPAGLFARSLAECLALQLAERGALTPVAAVVLDNLALVARRDVRRLAELAGCAEPDILDALAAIRCLDPRPGRAFDAVPVQALEPDVLVRPRATGGFLVTLDTTRLPKVLLDAAYHAEITASGDRTATTFANQCLRSANWLTRSLDQRARTIVKVASAIVQRQRAFFDGTDRHVSPLTLREVADDIAMHESTVSRVVANKALASPRGVFPLRAFFAVALDGADGAVSAAAVRARIRQLVEEETPARVRSDDAIVQSLKAAGIIVARRTVAKYREAMNIPSSVERRRLARQDGIGRTRR